ncbi:MAG: molybdopterin synthase sulfur carrier subunit [Gammaproteobacteria bacterium RIFCSPLOWO2_02_FULL_61_13]|nr:MAG: molybdopterin synthase sulfur carrier subunit [Gammaproteobacteria bacterium RIFCSPLOWO2_02_FULL_61_13]
MRITFKLYAGLGDYLPVGSRDNSISTEIEPGASAHTVLQHFNVPRERAHLMLLNGVYLNASERDSRALQEEDVLAVWPPVAGG